MDHKKKLTDSHNKSKAKEDVHDAFLMIDNNESIIMAKDHHDDDDFNCVMFEDDEGVQCVSNIDQVDPFEVLDDGLESSFQEDHEPFENINIQHTAEEKETEHFEDIDYPENTHKPIDGAKGEIEIETFEHVENIKLSGTEHNLVYENERDIEIDAYENIAEVPDTMIESFDDLGDKLEGTKISESFTEIETNVSNFELSISNESESFEHIGGKTDYSYESYAEKLGKHDKKYKQLIEGWTKEQIRLRTSRDQRMIIPKDVFTDLKYVAGVDISFPKDKNDLIHACACLVILTYPELEIVYKKCNIVHLTSVYVPQYLAFREVNPYIELFEELKEKHPELYPQIVLVDGNGLLHPRKFGIASHLGALLNLTTIGIAKKLFHVDGLEKSPEFKAKIANLEMKGSTLDLEGKNGFLYGKALKSTAKSTNPIFVSIGFDIDLESAIKVILECCKVRMPEPIRWADIDSREFLREHYEQHVRDCHEYNELNEEFLELNKLRES